MIVIDVGAHNGSVFSLPYSQNPAITVYAIEPNPKLCERLQSHNRPNLHVFCTAFGEANGVSLFYVNRDDQTSSLLRAHCGDAWKSYENQLEPIQVINVPVQRLDTFVQNQGITEIDILKIDAQGFDLQVLKGAGEALHSIRKIHLEVQLQPLYDGSATKEEIVEYLSDRGFELIRCLPQTNNLEENLEFVRFNRYRTTQADTPDFEVNVPYVGRLKMPKNDHVGQLLEKGTFECSEQAFLWLYLRQGDTFFDCGTHAGLFSAVATQCMAHTGTIVGFEPNSDCLDLYCTNLKHLGCLDFRALNVGLSDRDGTSDLLLGRDGMLAFSTLALGAATHPQIGQETVQVVLRSLDSLIDELNIAQVTLVKLDVEGWEGFVLDGARRSIAANKLPIWMIEFTEVNAIAAGTNTRELWQKIEQMGYVLCRFDIVQLRLVPERQKEYYPYENLFAVMDLEAVNSRLTTASSCAVAIATDLISRWDSAIDRQSFLQQLAHLQTVYAQLSQANANEHQRFVEKMQLEEERNSSLKEITAHLEEEIAYLSTGRAALRKLIKGSLRRFGLYKFTYYNYQTFVPIYNWLFRDNWQPATLPKSSSSVSRVTKVDEPLK